MITQFFTIKNGVLYVRRDNKFKLSPVREYNSFKITLKNFKSQRVKRWLVSSYEISEKRNNYQITRQHNKKVSKQ